MTPGLKIFERDKFCEIDSFNQIEQMYTVQNITYNLIPVDWIFRYFRQFHEMLYYMYIHVHVL